MEDKILSCIKQAKIHSLSTDIEEYLSHFSHEEQKLSSTQKAKFQNFVECLLQMCSTFLHEKQSDDNDVREIFISIQQCCQQKYCRFNNLLQVGRSFYHILINLLRLKHYNEAIYLSIYLKKVILQILQDGINNTETDTIVHHVYKNFWNHAIEVKHHQEAHDSLKHILSLRLRRVAFEFLCFKYSELNSICEQSSKAIIWYITNSNSIINNKELTAFCTSIWNSLVTNRTFQQSISNEQKETTIFSVLKMFKDWSKSLIKYIISKNLSVDILIWLDDIVELTKKIGDTNIMNITQSGTNLTKCALNILLDQNNSEVYKDIAKDFVKSSSKVMNKDFLISIIDPYISVSCYYLLEIFNMFEREKKHFNSKQVFSLDSFLDCITNVCTSTKDLIQSENCNQLVILIVRLQGRLIKIIREEVQKSLDANFIKMLIQRGKRIMQRFSIILDMKSDKYLCEDEYIGIEVGNLGIVLFGKDMHNYAIHCLEFSCEYLTRWIYSDFASLEKKILMQESLWKKYELLARSYYAVKQFEMSLKIIVKGLLLSECKISSAIDIWMKIKRELTKKNLLHIRKITMRQIINELGIEIKMENLLKILFAELKAYKSERHNNAEEHHFVIRSLLEICIQPMDTARTLLEMARWIWIYGDHYPFLVERSAIKCCREAINILKDQLNKEMNNSTLKFYLSLAYFWLYQIQMKNLQTAAQNEIQNSSKLFIDTENKTYNPRGDEEDKEEKCDINPAFSFTNIYIQEEMLKPLNKALLLWIDIFHAKSEWKNTMPMEELLEILDVVRSVAEIYNTTEKVVEEIKTWTLLKHIAKLLNNPITELHSLSMLIMILSKYHLMEAAKYFVNEGKTLSEEIVPLNSSDSYAYLIKLKFNLALSEYFFHSEQYTIGIQILSEVLTSSFLQRHTKSNVLLMAEAKKLASFYLLLSPKVFSITLEKDECSFNLLQTNTPINLAIESTKLCLGLLSHFSIADINTAMINKDSPWYKPYLYRTFIESSLLLGKLYVMIGAPREARCFLQESFTVAQGIILANRTISILILLAQLDFLCENYDDCNTKIKGLKYILNFNKSIIGFENIIEGIYSHNEESVVEEEQEEELFIFNKSGRSLKGEVRNVFLNIEDPQSSPPQQRKQNIITPSFFNHPTSCSCEICQYIPLHYQFLELMELQSSLNHYPFDKKEKILLDILKYHEIMLLKRKNVFTLILPFIFWKDKKGMTQNKNEIVMKSDISLFCHVSCKLAILKATQNKFSSALNNLQNAFIQLNKSSKLYEIIYADLFSELTLQKVFISLQYVFKQKDESKKILNVCENVSSEVSSIAEKISTLNLDDSNLSSDEFVKLPMKYLTKTPGKVSVKGRKVCRAPKKKKAPTLYMEKYIESLDKSDDSLCINLESDENTDFHNPKIQKQSHNLKAETFKYSHEKNYNLSSKVDMPKISQDMLKKDDDIDYFHSKIISNGINQEKLSHPEMQKVDIDDDITSFCNTSLKTYSTRHKQKKISKIKNIPEKHKSKENIEDRRNADDDDDFFLFHNISLDNSMISKMSNSPFDQSDYMANNQKLAESKWMTPEIFRTGDDSLNSMTTRSKTRKKLILNDSKSHSSHHKVTRKNSENQEAVECVVRSSVTDDILNNSFNEISNTVNSQIKHQEFDETEHISVKLEDLALELKHALEVISHYPVCPLYSNMCILMALLTKYLKNTCQDDNKFDVAYHISESVALTLKHQALITLTKKINKNENLGNGNTSNSYKIEDDEYQLANVKRDLLNFRNKFDHKEKDKIQNIVGSIPKDWTVVQVSTIPCELNINSNKVSPPVLLVTRFQSDSVPITVTIESKEDIVFENSFLPEFNKILKESAATMQKKDAKIWWMIRRDLDHQMKVLTESMENIWLDYWKGVFLGVPTDSSYKENLKISLSSILAEANKLNLVCRDYPLLEILLDSASSLDDIQLLSALCLLFKCDTNHKGCKQLVKHIKKSTVELNFGRVQRAPVILILDKRVQILPWENMPLLRQHPVCRVPSLSLLHTQLTSYSLYPDCTFRKGVDTRNTFYILNPSNDIPDTQKKFQDVFKQERGWRGIVGRAPTQQEFSFAITDHELFIYCGHGTGRVYLAGESIERLKCQAVTILMGCSSGKLKVYSPRLEPTGVTLQYWLGGSPCVVANLWDITDKDIDRFTEALLRFWLPTFCKKETGNGGTSIADAVSSARNFCKLPHLIGSAPVIYGLPVFTIQESS